MKSGTFIRKQTLSSSNLKKKVGLIRCKGILRNRDVCSNFFLKLKSSFALDFLRQKMSDVYYLTQVCIIMSAGDNVR